MREESFVPASGLFWEKFVRAGWSGTNVVAYIFWVSAVVRIVQLVTLSTRFNHHGTVLDFNAANVNRALGSDKVCFVTHAKGVIIDNDQPMI
jgi:hypothetical protein